MGKRNISEFSVNEQRDIFLSFFRLLQKQDSDKGEEMSEEVNKQQNKLMRKFGGAFQLCTPSEMQSILGPDIYTELITQCKIDIEELKKRNQVK